MKKIIVVLSLCATAMISVAQGRLFDKADCTYIFEQLPRASAGARNIFIFYRHADSITGRINATKEVFAAGKLGYKHGYVVSPMRDIRVLNDSTLSFTVSVTRQYAIEPYLFVRDEQEFEALGEKCP